MMKKKKKESTGDKWVREGSDKDVSPVLHNQLAVCKVRVILALLVHLKVIFFFILKMQRYASTFN